MRASWLAILWCGCAPAPPRRAAGPQDDAASGDPATASGDTASDDSGWPGDAPGWQAGLTLVHDGALVADGGDVQLDSAPAGEPVQHRLVFTLTNRGDAEVDLAPGGGTWVTGEAWSTDGAMPTALAPGESADFTLRFDASQEVAAGTRTATLDVPGGPTARLIAEVPRPLRTIVTGSGGAVWMSEDRGRSFTMVVAAADPNDAALDVTWGAGRFFRADRAGSGWGDPGTYAWSEDGESWTASTVAEEFWSSACAFGLDRFACARADALTWSTTGLTVVHQATAWGGHLNDITWAGDRFIAVGRSGRRAVSLDGESWSSEAWMTEADTLYAAAWAGDTIVAVGGDDRLLMTWSQDGGQTWEEQSFCAERYARAERVAHNGTRWLATANTNSCANVWTSNDGSTWTPQPDADARPAVLGVVGEAFIGAQTPWGQPSELLRSEDGLTWSVLATAPEGVGFAALASETWESP